MSSNSHLLHIISQRLKRQLPKSILPAALGLQPVLAAALGPLSHSSRSTRPPFPFQPQRSAPYPILGAALGPPIAAYGASEDRYLTFESCRLGNRTFGKLPLGKNPLGKYLTQIYLHKKILNDYLETIPSPHIQHCFALYLDKEHI